MVQAISRYRLIPLRRVPLFVHLITGGELLTALALLYHSTTRLSGIATTILGGVFVVASGSAVARQIDTSCGCIGTSDSPRVGFDTVMRAAVILLAGVALAVTNATSALPVGIAVAATTVAILPAIRSVVLARRERRRHEDQLARNVNSIVRVLEKEPQPVDEQPTIPTLTTEACS
jgi:Flp pilus assembly protein TadB